MSNVDAGPRGTVDEDDSAGVLEGEAHRSRARKAVLAAYAAVAVPAAERLPEPGPATFARVLVERMVSVEAKHPLAENAAVPVDLALVEAAIPAPAFGQRFRAARRAKGRGAKVR
jgi:hypothetical protein